MNTKSESETNSRYKTEDTQRARPGTQSLFFGDTRNDVQSEMSGMISKTKAMGHRDFLDRAHTGGDDSNAMYLAHARTTIQVGTLFATDVYSDTNTE